MNKDFVNEITFWRRNRKKIDEKYACVELGNSKHLCEKQRQLLKKMSKNIKISKWPITVTCEIELELALLLTGSKKIWMHQILFFIFSFRYFVDQDLNS